MNLLSIVGIGIVAAILSVIVRQTRPEQAVLVGLVAGCVILGFVLSQVRELMDWWKEIGSEFGFISAYLSPLVRIMGIAYLTQFAAQLCHDAGENTIAMKLELSGKIAILALSVPILKMILETIKSMLL